MNRESLNKIFIAFILYVALLFSNCTPNNTKTEVNSQLAVADIANFAKGGVTILFGSVD